MDRMRAFSAECRTHEYRRADVAIYPTDDTHAWVEARGTQTTRLLHTTIVALLVQCSRFKPLDEHLAAFCQGKQLSERVVQGLRSQLYDLARHGYLLARHQYHTRMNDILMQHTSTTASRDPAVHLYLDLLKRCLVNWIYMDGSLKNWTVAQPAESDRSFDFEARMTGSDWPANAHTMIGIARLQNIQWCVEDVLAHNIPGDLIETGVWRGGAAIFMRALLKAYGVQDRCVWAADSFAGLPPPNAETYPADSTDIHHTYQELAVSLEQVRANFERYGLLDERVRFLQGWFKDTLPAAPIEHLAVLRLDGDMYESTMDALVNLYPRLSVGGYVIIDDYALPGCRQAVDDYRTSQGITDEVRAIDWTGVYWQRSACSASPAVPSGDRPDR